MGLLKTELGPVVEEMYNHSKKLKLSKVTKPLFKFCVSLCDYILLIQMLFYVKTNFLEVSIWFFTT